MECRYDLTKYTRNHEQVPAPVPLDRQNSDYSLLSVSTVGDTSVSSVSRSVQMDYEYNHGYGSYGVGAGARSSRNANVGMNYENDYDYDCDASERSAYSTDAPLTRAQKRQIRLLSARYGTPKSRSCSNPNLISMPKERISFPRNIVLLELMEVASSQYNDKKCTSSSPKRSMFGFRNDVTQSISSKKEHRSTSRSRSGSGSIIIIDDGNTTESSSSSSISIRTWEEEQAVLSSIEVLASSYGEYIVKEPNGLPLYSVASVQGTVMDQELYADMDMNKNIVDSTRSGHWMKCGSKKLKGIRQRNRAKKKRLRQHKNKERGQVTRTVQCGQSVQIVHAQDGIYRLARNRGIIFADSTQLVKVGVAKESSCKVEGMIYALQSTQSELTNRLDDLVRSVSRLRNDLSCVLSEPENFPVIAFPSQQDPNQMSIVSIPIMDKSIRCTIGNSNSMQGSFELSNKNALKFLG